jgi:uncharacterized protein YyaL (SSP411 family)
MWLVPHFEKMLYDNALLARLYARAWQTTGIDRFRTVSTETLDYMLRDLGLPGGGFASSEDADSEGVEGRFYVFDQDEFLAHAGQRADLAARFFGVTPDGNFEGATILHEAASATEVAAAAGVDPAEVERAVTEARRMLLEHRSSRVRPGLDDKAVTAWNGLALRALAEAGWLFSDDRYLTAARATARFVLDRLRFPDGRLMRSRRGDRAGDPGFCDDYGAVALGLFALAQGTGEAVWFREAEAVTADLIARFADPAGDGFFATAHDAESLIARPKNLYDNPTPSDNSLAAEAVLTLEALRGPDDTPHLDGVFRAAGRLLEHPTASGQLLALAATRLAPPLEVAVAGPPGEAATAALLDTLRTRAGPGVFLAWGDDSVPLLAGRQPVAGTPAAYVCRGFTCDAPVTSVAELAAALSDS